MTTKLEGIGLVVTSVDRTARGQAKIAAEGMNPNATRHRRDVWRISG